jgi:serine-type D-Ala-D-Ala carboxypeptidase (penicillin-binding protein 5/6)
MKRIFFLLTILTFIIFPFYNNVHSIALSEIEREELLEKYNYLLNRLNYLRWYVEKFPLQKKINAVSFLVIDIENESVLLEKNSNHSHPIASITKLMTAIVALENIDIEEKITLSQEMFLANAWQQPSPVVYSGATLAVGDLIKASLIQSTNNAAQSLACILKEEEFIKLMNKKAQEIGMKNTFFYDAHGLSSLNRSSAPDIARLITYVANYYPEVLEITREENLQLPGKCPEHDWVCTFKNNNIFPTLEASVVSAFVGGKTGFTKAAGNTFTGVFKFKDSPYTIVLLNTPSRTLDTENIAAWLNRKP